MRLALVFGLVGYQLRLFSLAFLLPLGLALWDRHWASAAHFLGTLLGTFAFGVLTRRGHRADARVSREEALGVVTFTWVTVGVFSAVPYVCEGLSFVDALFESISGWTTTGATVLTDFSRYDRSFFLWRAMTQWFGGMGVIALFVVVLPKLAIAGRQLFFAEASGAPSEAVSPLVRVSAAKLWRIYSALTLLLIVLLMLTGFSAFDATVHAFATMAAGGFSPNPESLLGYHNAAADWILSVFMLLAGASYTLQYRALSQPSRLLRDGEFVVYTGIALVVGFALAVNLAQGIPNSDHLRLAFFQVTSLISSTGFANTDYNLWTDSSRALLLVVMLVGGCAGSAAGGPKVIRLLLVFKHVLRELKHVIHPRAVLPLRYRGRAIPDDVMRAVFMLVVLFMAGHFFVGLALVLMGSDLVLGFSAAVACLGNVGPGFGAAGPMGSFAGFSDPSKLLLTFTMLIGRLEIVTVLALLHPDVLRHIRLRG